MNYIKGIVIEKSEKWFTVSLTEKYGKNYLLINDLTKKLSVGDSFFLWVITRKKQNGKQIKWFHIAQKYKKRVVLGFDLSTLALQPIVDNIYISGGRVYIVRACRKRNAGLSYGYDTEYWWELYCDDITDTDIGIKTMQQIIL